MPDLNSRKIVRAVRQGKIPLLLRHLWQVKTGWDPLMQERYFHHQKLQIVAFYAWFLLCVLYAVDLFLFVPDHSQDKTSIHARVVEYVYILLLAFVLVLFVWKWWYLDTVLGRAGPNPNRHVRIGKPLGHFLELIDTPLQGLHERTAQELSGWAARILDAAAVDLIDHQQKEPQNKGSPAYKSWLEDQLAHQKKFDQAYDSLNALGLAPRLASFYKSRTQDTAST